MKTRSRGGGRRQASSRRSPAKGMAAASDGHDHASKNKMARNEARIELFFASPQQLKERVQLLQSHGYYKFNLVNKNAQDPLFDWAMVCGNAAAGGITPHVCAHYSLKYNKAARQGHDAHVLLLEDFLQQTCNDEESFVSEILLVSGGHNRSKPRPKWNTVEALQLLKQQKERTAFPTIAVAYNPYLPEPEEQEAENKRLQEKFDTALVSKVYLQFGTDLIRLKHALEFLSSKNNIQLAGSLFLPTKQLIAQQKFRPWNGVFLSSDFLSGPEAASGIVVQMIKLYQAHKVEILWEAPGIRTPQDVQLVEQLMKESGGSDSSPGQDDKDNTEEENKNDKDTPDTKRQKTLQDNSFKTVDALPLSSRACLLLFGAHDLRLYDNEAVQQACQQFSTVVPVFLWSPFVIESGGIRAEALEVVIKEAVKNLESSLRTFGLELICRNCPTQEDQEHEHALQKLLEATRASAIFYNKDCTPNGRKIEDTRTKLLARQYPDVQNVPCQSVLLYDIDQVSLSKGFHGGHWGTLMPFYKNCQKNYGPPRRPIPKHETFALLQKVQGPSSLPASDPIDNLQLAVLPPKHDNWHQPIKDQFPNMSYEGAQDVLNSFFQSRDSGFRRYESERSRADKELATTRLSLHLRVGTLSPHELYWKTEDHPMDYSEKKTFSRRLIWRDLAYYQLRCFPNMSQTPIRAHYQSTEWVTGPEEHRRLQAWKKGKTGYPIVDAGTLFGVAL
jgi:deoxyribodipyrimidine photolyase